MPETNLVFIQSGSVREILTKAGLGLVEDIVDGIFVYIVHRKDLPLIRALGYKISNKRPTSMSGVVWADIVPKRGDTKAIQRDRYVKLCMKTRQQVVKRCHDENKRFIEEKERLAREVAKATRRIEQNRHLIAMSQCSVKEHEKAFAEQFKKLNEMKNITAIMVEGNTLVVQTDVLYCVDPRTGIEHEIGSFRIRIDCGQYNISMTNTTRRVSGHDENMHAPHVFPRGNLCEGTLGEILPDLYGKYDYATIVMVAIQFVQSVNVDDPAGRYINRWPKSKRSAEEQAASRPVVYKPAKKAASSGRSRGKRAS